MKLDIDFSNLNTNSFIHVLNQNDEEFECTKLEVAEANPGFSVIILRGKRMMTLSSLFQEIAAALQFPYYFSRGWDALDECINDLSWLNTQGIILFISEADKVLSLEDQTQLGIFGEILKCASMDWHNGQKYLKELIYMPFHVFFQCDDIKKLKNYGGIFS